MSCCPCGDRAERLQSLNADHSATIRILSTALRRAAEVSQTMIGTARNTTLAAEQAMNAIGPFVVSNAELAKESREQLATIRILAHALLQTAGNIETLTGITMRAVASSHRRATRRADDRETIRILATAVRKMYDRFIQNQPTVWAYEWACDALQMYRESNLKLCGENARLRDRVKYLEDKLNYVQDVIGAATGR